LYPFAKTLGSVKKANLLGLMIACAGLALAVVLVLVAVVTSLTAFLVDLETGVAYAEKVVTEYLAERTRQAGADHVEVKMHREDQIAPIAVQWGGEIYLGTQLTFTAVGRPSLAHPE